MYPKTNLTICSDSQGKGLANEIESITGGKFNVFGYVRANTTLGQVVDSAMTQEKYPVVIIGGSNNSLQGNCSKIYKDLESKLSQLSKSRPAFITTIPTRYDYPLKHPVNIRLREVNNYIAELAYRVENAHLLCLDDFKRIHFTRQGLHLNQQGKVKLAHLIIRKICIRHGKLKVYQDSSPKRTVKSPSIEVVETNMECLIEEHYKDQRVGFAHSISSDFEDPRQMSAGVAVVFRRHFGRPATVHRVEDHLAQQKATDGATIFSLITKDHFFDKPTVTNYNKAFQLMTKYFLANNLKKLICSPIGCVRDRIQLEHFAKNLLEFRKQTGAQIIISSYFQKSYRVLRNGLSHDEFNIKLKELICSKKDPSLKSEEHRKSASDLCGQTQAKTMPGEDSYAEATKNQKSPAVDANKRTQAPPSPSSQNLFLEEHH
ncbi:purine nucleoside metabolic process [Homalodisca vitripennis]|nr:purine nucleoside metabolic process [Homalodisca vitripennis]